MGPVSRQGVPRCPSSRARRSISALSIISLAALSTVAISTTTAHAAARSFHVDCAAGNDGAAGTSPSSAWKSVAKANKAALKPGDSLLFKRGCTWSGTSLDAAFVGSSAAPITVASYGASEERPQIANAGIRVSGKFQVIDGFWVTFKPVTKDPCGSAWASTTHSSSPRVERRTSSGTTSSPKPRRESHVRDSGSKNTITQNTLAGNNVMQAPFDGKGDLGAWGMLVGGSDNDISYNTFRDNIAVCKKGTYVSSNSNRDLRGGSKSHPSQSQLQRPCFSELGSSSADKASDNSYAFNLHTSPTPGARFITTRGAKDLSYGPVWRTTADRNTINYTGSGSQGLVCGRGCSLEILTARYNVINVVEKTIYTTRPWARPRTSCGRTAAR